VRIRSSGEWQRIEVLFGEALPLDAAERARYLDQACANERELRADVVRLLAANEHADDFLESIDAERAAHLLAPSLETVVSIGRYRVIRRLGSGGMGYVYLAEDSMLGRQVAVKLLPPWIGAGSSANGRLLAEARAASAVDHPNVAAIHEVGETSDGRLFITMAYCEGETLRAVMQRGPLTAAQAMDVALQAARGLAAAHRRSVVHRDVKPENFIVRPDGTVRIVDFGIATLVDASPSGIAGTAAYMSPEQTLGAKVDGRTDVWSLGVVLFEMLARERPFAGDTRDALVAAIRSDAPSWDRLARGGTPAALRLVVERCLQKQPDERYQSAEELADALERAAVQGDEPRRGLGRRWSIGVAAAALALTAGAVWLSTRRAPVAPSPSMLAVLPFAPNGPDTLLHRLGAHLASTLGASLDGMGDLHAVVADTLDGAASAEAFARARGAGIVLGGTLSRDGARIVADGVLLGADGATPLARVSASAPVTEVRALSDSLALAVLQQLAHVPNAPTLGAGVATRSLAALRAYLTGERLADEYRMRAAAAAFASAAALDTGFRLAGWRHVWAAGFHELPLDSAVAASVLAHASDLPRPDRLLLEARRTPGIVERIARLESLAQQYPEYWQGLFELAELRLREGPFAGGVLAEAEAPLRRVVARRPRFVPAWDRLTWLALARRDTVASARALAALQRLRYDSTSRLDGRFDMMLLYRHLHHLARTGGTPDPAPTDSLARALGGGGYTPNRNGTPERIRSGIARYGFHAARIDLARRQIRAGAAGPFQLQVIANSWAARGGWDSALVVADSAAGANGRPVVAMFCYRLAAIGAWLGAVDAASAAAWRRRASAAVDRFAPVERAELSWIDGLLASAVGDGQALARARAALGRSGATDVGRLDSSLAAFGRELAGDRRGAIALLVGLEYDRHRPSNDHPYLSGVNRLTASRLLAAEGDTVGAAHLLTWSEAIFDAGPQSLHAETVLAPFSHLARARLLAARGDRDGARAQYAYFLALYDAPVAALRPLVEEARARR
jgi:hypothetical protein